MRLALAVALDFVMLCWLLWAVRTVPAQPPIVVGPVSINFDAVADSLSLPVAAQLDVSPGLRALQPVCEPFR
jgi:hypothetical protein